MVVVGADHADAVGSLPMAKQASYEYARAGGSCSSDPGRASAVPVCKGGRINVQGILHFCNATVIRCEKKRLGERAIKYG